MAHTLPLLMFAVLNALSCHSEVRARDPDTDEEEAVALGGWAKQMPGTFGTTQITKSHEHQHHGTSASMPSPGTPQNSANPSRETVHPPTHIGKWCPYINHRVVTTAVLHGTETKTVKSVNPCPDGTPDCQLNMYRLPSQPVYRQKQTVLYALQWRCCPGYGGHNCQEKEKPPENEKHVSKTSQALSESQHSEVSKVNHSDDSEDKMVTDLLEDMNWDDKPLQESPIRDSSLPVTSNQSPVGTREGIPTSQTLPLLDSSILLSMHQLMSAMMNQLQPVLESFNQTLMHLSSQVNILSQDLQQLRLEQEYNRSSRGEAYSGAFEETLDLQVRQMKTQLDTQRAQMEKALQTQQELLQQNISKLKEEMDDQIRQSMDAQVNLQSLTGLVEEVRLDQKRLEKALQREHVDSGKQSGSQPAQDSIMWQAITRLDENAQSNSAQLSSLSETSKDTARTVEDLHREQLTLQQRVEKVKQHSEVHFAEIGLEVEATRVRVLNSISELKTNLSAHEGQLTEIELTLDNIFNQLQRNDSPTAEQACNCKSIGDSLVRLELEVANVTQLAMENQLAFENAEQERNRGLWATEIEDLHQGLLNMKESLAFEQGRSRILNDNMSQLKASLLHSQQEIRDLRERDEAKSVEIRGLSATFSSLLNDAVRHSEVLEVLLGEEVLEFTHWSHNQQKELSIPNLLQKMQLMQQKIANHDRSLVSQRRKHPEEDGMNSDDPVTYSEWTNTKSQVRDSDSHHASLTDPPTGDDVDYSVSDFWSLGKEVEQLAGRVYLLEERCSNCTEPSGGSVVELQANVTSLNQSLEDHLRTFQKLFSHTEELTSSARSLNLDEVWRLVRRKEGKKRRGHQNQEQMERRGEKPSSRRNKRYTETEHATLQHSPVVFITSLDHSKGPNRDLMSRNVAVNHDAAFSATSEVFQAPVTGLYLFLVTLDFERGHSLAVLKRSGVPVASLRQEQWEKGGTASRGCLLELRQGETVTLEMMHGSLRKTQPGDNTLSGLLLFITEHKDMQ